MSNKIKIIDYLVGLANGVRTIDEAKNFGKGVTQRMLSRLTNDEKLWLYQLLQRIREDEYQPTDIELHRQAELNTKMKL